jgi:hypothetical protein
MKFNMQWLAFPLLAYAVFCLLGALVCIPDLIWGKEIIPMIALYAIVTRLTHAALSGLIGGLTYFAFRNTNITLTSK